MNNTEFENFRQKEKAWKAKKKEIALEILDILKSNKLSVVQINEVMEFVDGSIKCLAHL